MEISVFDLFSIGIGPSSSHTVGPMKAAWAFVTSLQQNQLLLKTNKITVELFGSLAFTGVGHGTDRAILMGLEGCLPDTVDSDNIETRTKEIIENKLIHILNIHLIPFITNENIIFNTKDLLPLHTNGMRFTAYNTNNNILHSAIYYSIGGGFILNENEVDHGALNTPDSVPYLFKSAKTLLNLCEQNQLSISELMLQNEASFRPISEIKQRLLHIANTMFTCIEKGCQTEGILPGGLNIKRRAPLLYQKLQEKGKPDSHHYTDSIEWLNLYAIAVNEENAAGGRVVTAPTNGAAGIIPAVLHYYLTFYPNANRENDTLTYLLTAGAIAILYKKNASISGAEVGCQGEVGVACSMAAAGFAALLGGDLYQIENAAEIAMEHHLGLTCDPIAGLVQIPCIERNAMGAIKAVNAARLSLLGDGKHFVSLDKVIATMKKTGADMKDIYKETSLGGLAANLPEC
jgi:L-serine dehydratase